MTWGNLSARMLSVGLVLPLALRQFTPGDAAYFLLLSSLVALQLILPSGFSPTFARFVSYALVGKRPPNPYRTTEPTEDSAAPSLAIVLGTMHRIYLVLALSAVPFGALLGYLLLRVPITHTSNSPQAWFAFGVILLSTPFALYGAHYSSFLQGTNRIALEQRWGAVFGVAAAATTSTALLTGAGLIGLVATHQAWQILGFFRLRYLSRAVRKELVVATTDCRYDPHLFRDVWPPAWRSLVGVAMSGGILQASGLVYAQLTTPAILGPFLIGLRLIAVLSEISRAPFYSKLPIFSQLYANGQIAQLQHQARVAMTRAYGCFLLGFGALTFGGSAILRIAHTQTPFPDTKLWALLGGSFLIERYGAMHIQLLSISNRIIWHWANGISGLLLVAISIFLFPYFHILGFAAAIGLSYLLCFSWVAPYYSYKTFRISPLSFESKAALPAFLSITTICAIKYLTSAPPT